MSKTIWLFAIMLLALPLVIYTPMYALPKSISGVFPPSSGDWIIDKQTLVSNEVIIVNGSIIVKDGGTLILDNATILMNLGSPGEHFIHVESGGNLTVLNSLITAYDKRNKYYFYVDSGAKLRIENSTIKYSGIGQGIYSGLWIAADNSTILNTDIWYNTIGLEIYGANNVYLRNITVWYGETGLYVYGAKNLTLIESDIKYQLGWSILILNTEDSTFSWSIFRNGLYLAQGNWNLDFYQDTVYGTLRIAYTYNTSFSTVGIVGKGIYIVDAYDNSMNNVRVNGLPVYYGEKQSNIVITGSYSQVFLVMCNNVTVEYVDTSNVAVGVELYLTNNSVVRHVNISDSDSGVVLYGSQSNLVTKSVFNNTQHGVEILGENSVGNLIFLNDFINSTVYDDGYSAPYQNMFDNGTYGNYWSDYSGLDSNGDGVGDAPYVIDSNSNDTRPLVYRSSFYVTDADNDGLLNIVELTKSFEYWVNEPSNVSYVQGTDPYKADTDNDGLTDGQEVALKTNPLDSDTDNDGLLDGQEGLLLKADGVYMSDPHLYDTDSDGLSDGEECLIYGTNPSNNDTDNDGVLDYQEILADLDPTNNDTDGDGFLDGYELAMNTDPKDPNNYPPVNKTDNSHTLGKIPNCHVVPIFIFVPLAIIIFYSKRIRKNNIPLA